MKDFKAISNTIKNELKHKIFGKSAYGNTDILFLIAEMNRHKMQELT